MAIRLRPRPRTRGAAWDAFCAAKTPFKPGDVYISDSQHDALTNFYLDKLPFDIQLGKEAGDEDNSGNDSD